MSCLIAGKIAEQEGLPIECRYLEGSRYAWRMAEFFLPGSDPIAKICIGGIHVTLRKILKRGGLSDGEAVEVAELLCMADRLDEQLTYADTIALKPKLSDCRELRVLIGAHAKEAYENTVGYLAQEGLTEGEPFGIVDSGWVGSMQQTLCRLIRSATGRKLDMRGFYFGLYELPKGVEESAYHTFYFSPYRDIERKVSFSNCLFEAVCSAAEGMTVGYRKNGQKIEAVYESGANPNRERILENEALLKQLLASAGRAEELVLPQKEMEKRLRRLMGRPTKAEALCYGSYLFSDDVSAGSLQKVAADLGEDEIRNLHVLRRFLIMKGIRKKNLKDSAWPEGSAVNSGRHVRYHLWQIRWYKRLIYIRKRLKNRKENT